jgi:glycine cleavage system regulatory protein
MRTCVVMTVLAPDRTGIVKALSETVAGHGGNWLESRMARMAGQFAGIVRIECEHSDADALVAALKSLDGLSVVAHREDAPEETHHTTLILDVVGNDRPGIVRQLSSTIAGAGANLDDLHTALESAPMSGHPLFHATATVSLPDDIAPGSLIESIENLSEDLAVTVVE